MWPGVVVDTEGDIRLEDVPIVTPNSDVVVPSLSFQVKCVNRFMNPFRESESQTFIWC